MATPFHRYWLPAIRNTYKFFEPKSVEIVTLGRVVEIDFPEPNMALASVQGTRSTAYRSRVTVTQQGGLTRACSCPVGFNCKHTGAVSVIIAAAAIARGEEGIADLVRFLPPALRERDHALATVQHLRDRLEPIFAEESEAGRDAGEPSRWWLAALNEKSEEHVLRALVDGINRITGDTVWGRRFTYYWNYRFGGEPISLAKRLTALIQHLSAEVPLARRPQGLNFPELIEHLQQPEIDARFEHLRRLRSLTQLSELFRHEAPLPSAKPPKPVEILWRVQLAHVQPLPVRVALLEAVDLLAKNPVPLSIRQLKNLVQRFNSGAVEFQSEAQEQALQLVAAMQLPAAEARFAGGFYHDGSFGSVGEMLPVTGMAALQRALPEQARLHWSDSNKLLVVSSDPVTLCIGPRKGGGLVWGVAPENDRMLFRPLGDVTPFVTVRRKGDRLEWEEPMVRMGDRVHPFAQPAPSISLLGNLSKEPTVEPELYAEAGNELAAVVGHYLSPAVDPAGVIEQVPVRLELYAAERVDGQVELGMIARAKTGKQAWEYTAAGMWVPHKGKPSKGGTLKPIRDVLAVDGDSSAEPAQSALVTADPKAPLKAPRRDDIKPFEAWWRRLPCASDPEASSYAIPCVGLVLKPRKADWEPLVNWWIDRPANAEAWGNSSFAELFAVQRAPSIQIDVEASGVDWLSVSVKLEGELEALPWNEVEAALAAGAEQRFVRLKSGALFQREDLERYRDEVAALNRIGLEAANDLGEQRVHALQATGLESAGFQRLEAQEAFARLVQSLREKLANFQGIEPAPIDEDIAALLRPYQRTGADFLAWACSAMGGALLADDMGLGKTIQSIATITALRNRAEKRKPTLVVCPTSVVRNWARECGRFAPGLRVGVVERGDSRSDVLARASDFDVVVINYALARIDVEKLAGHDWMLVIIDEAQAIKNAASQVAKALKRIRADYRIALTGTPIENRVGDLLSIMEFVAKGYLGSASKYKAAQGPPTAIDRQRLQLLRARLRPVLLRRLKSEVLQELPDRIEEQIDCTLEGRQRTLYLAELKRARVLLGASKDNNLAGTDRIQLLAALTRLRQLCCHPQLLGHEDVTSAKVESLLELLETLLAEGHKVLVFSQFVRFLNIVRSELESLNIPHWMLTGETTNRHQLVDEFQAAAEPGVFLLSLKAGGTGLNLTAASHVVLLDPWWNPAVEAQAIDRSHRIGQTKTVVAFRLIMRETIEDRILELQEQKKELFRSIVEEEAFDRTLSKEDFAYLFAEIDE